MRLGYVPNSGDLQHPADRRRLAAFSRFSGASVELANPLASEVLVLSNAANYGYWFEKEKSSVPIVLDLVDAYLGERPSIYRDVGRNIIRTMKGTSELRWLTYTRHLKFACKSADAIIVPSEEQRQTLLQYNKNIHVVLDDHREIDENIERLGGESFSREPALFWEGLGYTLKHFGFISSQIDRFLTDHDWRMYILTAPTFFRWGGIIGLSNSSDVVKRMFPRSWKRVEVIPWSLDSLVEYAQRAALAVIPIDPQDRFAYLKSENKLLSMWHLNLPTITSPTPSYKRTMLSASISKGCVGTEDWYSELTSLVQDSQRMDHLRISGKKYIEENHSSEFLMNKWQSVLATVEEHKRN